MEGIGVRLAHASPGRIRLKIEEIKNDPRKAGEIEDQLRTVPGIHSVQANPVTGSLLLTYDEPALESMELPFAVAKVLGISLNDLDPEDLRLLMSHQGNGNKFTASSVTEGLESAVKEMNSAVGARSVRISIFFFLWHWPSSVFAAYWYRKRPCCPRGMTISGIRSVHISF